jgi:hypothetical protein
MMAQIKRTTTPWWGPPGEGLVLEVLLLDMGRVFQRFCPLATWRISAAKRDKDIYIVGQVFSFSLLKE